MATSIGSTYPAQAPRDSTSTSVPFGTQTTTTTSSPVGVSSVSSSIQSSGPASVGSNPQRSSLLQDVCNVVKNVFRAICECFSKIPVIGGFFEKSGGVTTGTRFPLIDQSILQKFKDVFNNASQQGLSDDVVRDLLNEFQTIQQPANKINAFCTVLSSENANDNIIRAFWNALPAGTLTDQDLLQRFETIFNNITGHANPSEENVRFLLNSFKVLFQSPVHKMEAFDRVLATANSSDEIARAFYEALPEGSLNTENLNRGDREASKASLRHQLYIQNNHSSQIADQDYGIDFGEVVMHDYPRDPLVQAATKNLINALKRAPVQTTTRSSEPRATAPVRY